MNYLSLVQRLWMEAGCSGASPGPSTVITQTGEYARLVTWVNSAWKDIQTKHKDWDWMRQSASFVTVASQPTYALGTGAGTTGVSVATFGEWARDTGRSYLTSSGTNSEAFVDYISYDDWRNSYQFGAFRNSPSRPLQISIAPDKSICLGPIPLVGYTITLDYFTAPVDLAIDADIPSLPTEYHEMIVWRALMYYGRFEGATEAYDGGEEEYEKLLSRLEAARLPEVTFGGALA